MREQTKKENGTKKKKTEKKRVIIIVKTQNIKTHIFGTGKKKDLCINLNVVFCNAQNFRRMEF